MNLVKTCLFVAVLLIATRNALAGNCCCPECGATTCSPVCVPVTEKHHCYEVECKTICIPKISCPWEKCCKPKCGRVKTVKVLKKVDYECKSCGCKWELNCVECCQPKCLEIPAGNAQPPLPPTANTRAVPHRSQVANPQQKATSTAKEKPQLSFFQRFVTSLK